jgi:HAD superfamily hydrolase (TIGR01549 family)
MSETKRHSRSAVLLDFDDTLALTSDAGSIAYDRVAEMLREQEKQEKASEIIARLKSLLAKQSEPGNDVDLSADPSSISLLNILSLSLDDGDGDDYRDSVHLFRVGQWSQALREHGVEHANALAWRCYRLFNNVRLQNVCVHESAWRLLDALAERRMPVAIVTNGPSAIQWPKLRRCKALVERIEHIVVSGDVRATLGIEPKPCAEIFAHAAKLLGVDIARCIMIGDSLRSDIEGARNAGLAGAVHVVMNRIEAQGGGDQSSFQVATVSIDNVDASLSFIDQLDSNNDKRTSS